MNLILTSNTAAAPSAQSTGVATQNRQDKDLRQTADKLEGAFISEMLKHAGLAKAFAPNADLGSDAYSTFLLEEYADRLVGKGGFGLSELIFDALKEKKDA